MSGPIFGYLQTRAPVMGPAPSLSSPELQHWQLRLDAQGVAWLLMDQAQSSVNTLSGPLLEELDQILAQLEASPPSALVLRSAKAGDFCLGADIGEFRRLEGEAAVVQQLQRAHAIVNRLEQLNFPTLAVIHGHCLGGGLELALCCDLRLALPDARLGLPEILLGLHPGLGGTARLPHLIDPLQAMTLMLTGKTLNARRAYQAGLVDAVIEERHLEGALRAAREGSLSRRPRRLKSKLLNTRAARQIVARQMRAKTAEKADPTHYPAPSALIDLWQAHGGDADAMRQAETRSFAKLLHTDTAQNLVRVFFLQEKLKALTRGDAGPVRWVHVIGAGTMGADIAAWCAYKGLAVSLHDPKADSLAKTVARTAELCRRKHLDETRTRAVLDRLVPDPDNQGVSRADLVIEAVPEKADLKRAVYAEIEPRLKPGTLLATNTSSIPLEELQQTLADTTRFVGLHFFNPVAHMLLVEVVAPAGASEETLARARAFAGQIDRRPAPVASAPGFLVNRVLMPYLLEAVTLLDEGLAPETIDRAAKVFGMPLGPLELADRVGLDICLDVAQMLAERLQAPMTPIPTCLHEMVDRNELGQKTGQGFYRWEAGKAEKADADDPPAGLQDRLLLPLLNACMSCLREGVIEDHDLLDGAVIFGTGFAPFRGGPLHYARQRGYREIADRLEQLRQRHGERFKPDPGWSDP
ncbi:3-hydroxyacyl-CoA dehydrogenase NAD-binding domain-containing protein [Motiliproteus sp. SC1-56]|uniref:3-hydroxyacyl-CoA dehydrogenase NAD-binding domain-containing protein n=1 Tax=Motiliproteus sp. SC1-56 TaxID=2799565 RepID=UPI001A8C09DE|nr:3-hydroxyacyl-CoA dehydrogenase NAD-binding domain-containing protein [Motiliproteus sp. SC1-56]